MHALDSDGETKKEGKEEKGKKEEKKEGEEEEEKDEGQACQLKTRTQP